MGQPAMPPPVQSHGLSARTPTGFERPPTTDDLYVVAPPAVTADPLSVEVWPEAADAPLEESPRGRRAVLALAAVLGAAVLLGGAVVGVQTLAGRDGETAGPPATSAPFPRATTTPPPSPTGGAPPTQVKLDDRGGSVVITWRDPSAGKVPFLVTGGRAGTAPRALQTVSAGRTRSIIYGLNTSYNYCFTVTAVYSADVVAPSPRLCTQRVTVTSTS
jgi:hypothetical protein